ncbi:MAG: hypothetical protein HUU08_17295 [Candidatus Brocadia sp.]|nr:hypothetical protein [Candidatus Brocadia sp.]
MAEQRGFFAAWVEQDKERLTEDILKAVRSHTEPKIGLVHVPRDEKQIWDESKQGDRTKLIEEYLQAAEEVKKNKKLPPSESLKKLITPLINLRNITFPPGYESRLKFIVEDIDLEKELGENPPIPTTSKYTIIKDTELRELGILRVSSQNIRLAGEYADDLCKQWKPISRAEFEKIPYAKEYSGQDEQTALNNALDIEQLLPYSEPLPSYWSVSDIYELWLPTLTPEKIKSNDLLDRILVTYTIKRALNQDEKAINKLCSLFQDAAEKVAKRMARKRGLKTEDIKQLVREARILLRLTIGGFSLREFRERLSQGHNWHIPNFIEKFYAYWLSEEVPKRLTDILQKGLSDPFDILVLFNPFSLFVAKTEWRLTPKAERRFNNYSFRPNNKTNLYTWLFGTNKRPMQGRFCQLISKTLDRYNGNTKEKASRFDPELMDSISGSGSQALSEIDRRVFRMQKYKDRIVQPKDVDDETMEEIRNFLKKRGISERDIEMIIQKRILNYSYAEVSNMNNLTRRQTINILNKYKKYQPSLDKLRDSLQIEEPPLI